MRAKRTISAAILLMISFCFSAACADEDVLLFPENLTVIEDRAFYGTVSAPEAVVPETVEEIGEAAFAYSGLKKIHLPSSLRSIADNAFEGCEDLMVTAAEGSYAYDWAIERGYIDLAVSVTCEAAQGEVGAQMDWTAEINHTGAAEYSFELYCGEEKVAEKTSVSSGVFTCFPVKAGEYVLKASVEVGGVRQDAVSSPVIVKAAESAPASSFVYTIQDGVVRITKYTGANPVVIVPDRIEGFPVTSVNLCTNPDIESVVLPDTVTTIETEAFYACYKLKFINIPDRVQVIKPSAFTDCRNLTTVSFGSGLSEIGSAAFKDCRSLENVSFEGEGPRNVKDEAFSGCSLLPYFQFGAGLQGVGYEAFYNCTSLKEVVFGNGDASAQNVQIDTRAFAWCGIRSIILPEGVVRIKDYAFAWCADLQEIELPESVAYLGYDVFSQKVSIMVVEGSYAHETCVRKGYKVVLKD